MSICTTTMPAYRFFTALDDLVATRPTFSNMDTIFKPNRPLAQYTPALAAIVFDNLWQKKSTFKILLSGMGWVISHRIDLA